jgi:hypothetical protein
MLMDGLQMLHGSAAGLIVVAPERRGTTFPASPVDKDVFEMTEDGAKPSGVYFYSAPGSDWELFSPDRSATPYDIGTQIVGKPVAGATVLQFTVVRAFTILENFKGCVADSLVASATSVSFNVLKKERGGAITALGQIVFGVGGEATFTQTNSGDMLFLIGETLFISAPDPQSAALADISISIAGHLRF